MTEDELEQFCDDLTSQLDNDVLDNADFEIDEELAVWEYVKSHAEFRIRLTNEQNKTTTNDSQ